MQDTIWTADGMTKIATIADLPWVNGKSDWMTEEANAALIASAPELLAQRDALKAALTRLMEKTKRANDIQHSGGTIEAEDWSELYDLTNEARAALARTEGV